MKTDFVKDLTQFDKFCHFKFLRKPLEILGDKSVSGLVMKPCVMKDATIKDWHQLEKMQSIEDPTAPLEIKPFDLIVSCIGSTNDKLINLPIDSYGKILNTDGAVNGVPGVYVCGWAATGGKGDLTETFRSGRELAQKIIRETEASPNLQPFFY